MVLMHQIKVADSAAVPYVLHRGGVLEAVYVRATPHFGPADNEPRFSNVAIRCVVNHGLSKASGAPLPTAIVWPQLQSSGAS